MADMLLAATAHNASAAAVPEAGLSGQAVQGAIQGAGQAASSMPATGPALTEAAVNGTSTAAAPAVNATAATPAAPGLPGLPGLVDSAANTAGAAVNAASGATGIPVESTFSWGGYFQAVAVLLLLLGMLWGLVWAMRKFGKFNFMPRPGDFPRDSLRVEAQVPLGPRKGLVVVRFLNRRILLGVTDQQITFLTEAGHDNETDGMDFQGIMEEARRQKPDG